MDHNNSTTQEPNKQVIKPFMVKPHSIEWGGLPGQAAAFTRHSAGQISKPALPHVPGTCEEAPKGKTTGFPDLCVTKTVTESAVLLNLINTSQQAKEGSKTYKGKIVVSGDIVQVYEYQKVRAGSVRAGRKTEKENTRAQKTGEVNYTTRIDNARRAISQCKRLINSNAGKSPYSDKFVTLTFKEEETNLARCNNLFKCFIKRLEYSIGQNIEYIAVPQIQWKRFNKYGVKVWHYHVLLFGMDYLKNSDLRKIWGLGFIRINAIDKITDVGSYASRYMEKDFEGVLVKNHRRYLTSSGLCRPTEMRVENIDELPVISEDFEVFHTEYKNNEQVGWVKFTQYNFKKPPEPQEKKQEGK
jgi:hypothetical protein